MKTVRLIISVKIMNASQCVMFVRGCEIVTTKSVCLCSKCVCVRERERERERGTGKVRERERDKEGER